MRVLIVEDDPVQGDSLAASLRLDGYDVMWAPNGKAALTTLEVFRPHVLVVDLLIGPGLEPTDNGVELLKMIRLDPRYKDTPAILTTAASEETIQKVGDDLALFSAVLQKSFEVAQLESVLSKLTFAESGIVPMEIKP